MPVTGIEIAPYAPTVITTIAVGGIGWILKNAISRRIETSLSDFGARLDLFGEKLDGKVNEKICEERREHCKNGIVKEDNHQRKSMDRLWKAHKGHKHTDEGVVDPT